MIRNSQHFIISWVRQFGTARLWSAPSNIFAAAEPNWVIIYKFVVPFIVTFLIAFWCRRWGFSSLEWRSFRSSSCTEPNWVIIYNIVRPILVAWDLQVLLSWLVMIWIQFCHLFCPNIFFWHPNLFFQVFCYPIGLLDLLFDLFFFPNPVV